MRCEPSSMRLAIERMLRNSSALRCAMPVPLSCPKCRKPLSVPSKKIGESVACPACGASFVADAPATDARATVIRPPPPPRVRTIAVVPEGSSSSSASVAQRPPTPPTRVVPTVPTVKPAVEVGPTFSLSRTSSGDTRGALFPLATDFSQPVCVLAAERAIDEIAVSPDGRFLATCGCDGSVVLWDLAARKASREFKAQGASTDTDSMLGDSIRRAARLLDHRLGWARRGNEPMTKVSRAARLLSQACTRRWHAAESSERRSGPFLP